MARTEKRQLEIIAAVRDFATAPLRVIGKSLQLTFGAGLKTVGLMRQAINGTQTALAALVGSAAIKKAVDVFGEVLAGLAAVNNQAAATNTTAESLRTLRGAAELNGIEFDQLSAALRTFSKNIGDARQGAATQNESLRRLGLTTAQFSGAQGDAVEQMATVADALANVQDASVRTNLALKLFGEDTGAALLPLLAKGGKALRDYATELRASGNALTSEQIESANAYGKAVNELQQAARNIAETLATAVAPQVTRFFRDLRAVVEDNGAAIKEAFVNVLNIASQAAGVFVEVIGTLRKALLGLTAIVQASQLGFYELTGDVDKARDAMNRLYDTNEQIKKNEKLVDELSGKFYAFKLTLDQLDAKPVRVVVTATAEAGDEIDNTSSKWNEFWRGFSENSKRATNRFTDFYTSGLNAANQLVDQGLQRVGDTLGDVISGTKKGKEAFRELAKSVLQDISKIIGRLIVMNLVSSLFSSGGGEGGDGGVDISGNEKGGAYRGTITKTMPLRRFERGGIVRRPTLALFGEGKASKGEAFVPLPDGRRIPVQQLGGDGGGTVLNFNISAMDGKDVARVLFNNRGTLRQLSTRDLVANQKYRQTVRGAVS